MFLFGAFNVTMPSPLPYMLMRTFVIERFFVTQFDFNWGSNLQTFFISFFKVLILLIYILKA